LAQNVFTKFRSQRLFVHQIDFSLEEFFQEQLKLDELQQVWNLREIHENVYIAGMVQTAVHRRTKDADLRYLIAIGKNAQAALNRLVISEKSS